MILYGRALWHRLPPNIPSVLLYSTTTVLLRPMVDAKTNPDAPQPIFKTMATLNQVKYIPNVPFAPLRPSISTNCYFFTVTLERSVGRLFILL